MKTEREQIKKILSWFKESTKNSSDEDRVTVLRRWAKIAAREERFKVAQALKDEMDVVQDNIDYKKCNRWQKMLFKIKKFFC